MIPPSVWLPELWGGEHFMPEWEAESEFSQFMSLLMQHMNNVATMLMDFPRQYRALFKLSN